MWAEREVLGVILWDRQHGVLDFHRLLHDAIDSASVYAREVTTS